MNTKELMEKAYNNVLKDKKQELSKCENEIIEIHELMIKETLYSEMKNEVEGGNSYYEDLFNNTEQQIQVKNNIFKSNDIGGKMTLLEMEIEKLKRKMEILKIDIYE